MTVLRLPRQLGFTQFRTKALNYLMCTVISQLTEEVSDI